MKKLTALILCILLLCGCAEVYDGPTQTARVLSESTTEHYFPIFGTLAYVTRTAYAYDTYGNLAQEVFYTDDEVSRKITWKYDADGNLLEFDHRTRNGWFLERFYRETSSYDAQGLLRTRKLYHDEDTYVHTYTYDDLGRVLTHDMNGETDVYVYDDANNTETLTESDGSVTVRQFDDRGHLLREEETSSDGTVKLREYTRREDGQIVTFRIYKNGVLESAEEYTYDDQGRPLLHTVTGDGRTRTLSRWEYAELRQTRFQEDGSYVITDFDQDGNVLSETRYASDGDLRYHTTYTYRDIQVPVKEETP